MNELYLEIQEDVRRERFEKLWSSFGRLMVYASIAVLVLVALFVAWQEHTRTAAAEKTSQLLKGIDRMNIEDYKGAVPIFSSLESDSDKDYSAIASLRKAEAQTLSGDKEGAQKTYDALAKKDSELADLAKFQQAQKGVITEVGATSPFYYTLNEYNAWQLLSQGKKPAAVEIFVMLVEDEHTPHTMAVRLREVVQHLAPEKMAELNKAGKNDAHE